MARKKAGTSNPNGVTDASTSIPAKDDASYDSQDSSIVGVGAGSETRLDILGTTAGVKRDAVKVNNASLTELKNACDDAVKSLLSHKDLFTTIHKHTDVKLTLGWASVFVAAATALYGWKVEFEESKPLVWAGFILYLLLSGVQTVYAYLVEGETIYIGKRKTLSKRIETERIIVSSRTIPSQLSKPPRYAVTVNYVRSANGGKSLLGRSSGEGEKPYNEMFDGEGTMDQEKFDGWLGRIVERVVEQQKLA